MIGLLNIGDVATHLFCFYLAIFCHLSYNSHEIKVEKNETN